MPIVHNCCPLKSLALCFVFMTKSCRKGKVAWKKKSLHNTWTTHDPRAHGRVLFLLIFNGTNAISDCGMHRSTLVRQHEQNLRDCWHVMCMQHFPIPGNRGETQKFTNVHDAARGKKGWGYRCLHSTQMQNMSLFFCHLGTCLGLEMNQL